MAATYVIVTNLTSGTLAFSGDKGIPAVTVSGIPGSKTANILMRDLLGNKILCESLSTWITAGTVSITRGGVSLGAADLTAYAQGSDMNRKTYDADDDGIVDAAESIEFASVTATTALAVGDSFLIYDLSETETRKVTVPVAMDISVLAAAPVLAADDSVLLYDLSTTTASKLAVSSLLDPDPLAARATALLPADTLLVHDDALSVSGKVALGTLLDPDPLAARATALLPADTLLVHDDALSVSGKVALGTLLDPNPLAAEVLIADDDEILIHDTSAVASRKMTVANFLARKVFQSSDLQAVAATADVTIFVAPAAGTILGVVAVVGTAAAAAESLSIDVEIGGASALTAPVVLDDTSALAPVHGIVDVAAADFVAGDVIVVARTYAAGGGPTPMANSVISVWANVAL